MAQPGLYDVVVLGGGPAGMATALRLADLDHTVLVAERSCYRNARAGEHLPPGAIPTLGELGLSRASLEHDNLPSQGIVSRWGRSEPLEHHYAFTPHGCGINLSRPAFERMLADFAIGRGVIVVRQCRTKLVSRNGKWAFDLKHTDGTTRINGSFAVDATGRSAWFSRALGCAPRKQDKTIGLIRYCQPRHRQMLRDGVLYIEAVQNGWLSSAPLCNETIAVTFVTDADLIKNENRKSCDVWQTGLDSAPLTASRILPVDDSVPVHVAPAQSQALPINQDKDWLAVGDAALAKDPLSGNGIDFAIRSGIAAANAIHSQLTGSSSEVRNYKTRTGDQFKNYLFQRRQIYRQVSEEIVVGKFWQRR